ncbi:MAG: hypothetical protein LAN71_17135 [Acidobacteriia bacterium]|nr:hypothetical protein [Terriglobia bacterium]
MNFNTSVLAYEDKDDCYDGFVGCLLGASLEHINDELDMGKEVFILFETTIGLGKKEYKGFENVFKITGLIEIMNNYFVRTKSDLVATKGSYKDKGVIKISRLTAVVEKAEKVKNVDIVES